MIQNADLNAYICGGYFLAKRIRRPQGISELMPDSVLTISDCFTDVAPDTWAMHGYNYDDEERAAEALKFGIPAGAVPSLVNDFSREIGQLHANVFPTLSLARQFYQHCTDKVVVALLGIGLEPSLLPSFYAQRDDDVNHGYGLIERVDAKHPLAPHGEPLGYEPLGFEGTKFHSWLCHYVPAEAYTRFGIRPNRHGFIGSLADAVRVTQHMKATGAEPAIWQPWLMVQYSDT